MIRLTIAAARADGTLTPKEEAAILTHARTAGAESLVAAGAPGADAAAGAHRRRTARRSATISTRWRSPWREPTRPSLAASASSWPSSHICSGSMRLRSRSWSEWR